MKRSCPKRVVLVCLLLVLFCGFSIVGQVYADDEDLTDATVEGGTFITVSPMRESVVLNPGDTYKSSFVVSNPGYSIHDLNYTISVDPFYVDENYDPIFIDLEGNSLIADWIKITSPLKGTIEPNESEIIEFTIDVPEDAPAGGQYASISATTDASPSDGGSINIGEALAINHIVLGEITGNTVYSGDIEEAGVQSFLLGGVITGHSTVNNTGNVHALAKYTMKVYSLFDNELLYSNEDNIEDHYVLPGRSFYTESYWDDTPSIGIFNVYYKVEFQGITTEVTRMVIACPLWLLFIIMLILAILVIRIITLIRLRKADRTVF